MPLAASENGSAPNSASVRTASDAGPNIVDRLGLTQEQIYAILRVPPFAPAARARLCAGLPLRLLTWILRM